MNYETGHLTFKQANKFCKEFDVRIGTERVFVSMDINIFYVLCCRLLSAVEVNICVEIETNSL